MVLLYYTELLPNQQSGQLWITLKSINEDINSTASSRRRGERTQRAEGDFKGD